MTDYAQIQQDHPCREIISRYVTVTKKGRNKFIGPCPFHEDRGTHLSTYAVDGTEWWYCTVCHEGGDVVDFVASIEHCTKSLAAERITDELLPPVGTFTPKPVSASEAKAWRPIIPVPLDAPPYKPELTYIPESGRLKNWERVMDRLDAYHDENGRLICWVIRIKRPGGETMSPTVTWCGGPDGERKWCAKRMDPPYPLMGLDNLEQYKGRWVLLQPHEQAKMEHDQNCPQKNGGPALLGITWLGGPKAVEKVDWSPLYDRHVDYAPFDNEAGRRAMKKAHEIIVENRIERSGTGIGRS